MSLKVENYVDLDTHGMFICTVTESRVLGDKETMTYSYYHQNVKPKPDTEGKKGYVCKICGYVYEGDPLPEDFICPLCKHGAADFEKIGEEPKQEEKKLNKFVCSICNYEHLTEDEELPEDFTCPKCTVPASLFNKKP
jgi:rubredoxin